MKNNNTMTKKQGIEIILQITLMFFIAIAMSYIGESLHGFFGDWVCKGYFNSGSRGCYYSGNYHDPTWHWGYRHWLYWFMGFVLFVVQAVFIFTKDEKTNN
jgi:hypothetical protein